MRLLLFISFLFSLSCVNAQKGKRNGQAHVEFQTFKLPKFPIADFPKRSIPVSDIQVIQVLRDSIRMGYALKGNDVVVLVPEKPPTYFLQEGIYKMYRDDFKKGGVQVLWVIKDLRVGEKVGVNQYAYLRFNADAYISTDLVLYKPVCSIDTVFMNESGVDVTAWHGEHIEDAFRLLLKRTLLAGKIIPDQSTPGGLSIEKIKENSNPLAVVPILHDAVYREGAYANFEEFLQNKPSIINFRVFSIGKNREIKFVKISENNNADTVNIWGICKGGEIYKYSNGLLVSIEKQGSVFIISNYIEQASRRNSGVFVTGFLGGMAGGIIVGITTSRVTHVDEEDPLLVNSIPYIKKAKKQPEATCIDMKTGELSF